MTARITSRSTVADVRDMLREDGYPDDTETARAVRAAHRRGALLWTRERLTTTDASRLDLRAERAS